MGILELICAHGTKEGSCSGSERKAALFLFHWTQIRGILLLDEEAPALFWKPSMFSRPEDYTSVWAVERRVRGRGRSNNILEDFFESVNQPILESTTYLRIISLQI